MSPKYTGSKYMFGIKSATITDLYTICSAPHAPPPPRGHVDLVTSQLIEIDKFLIIIISHPCEDLDSYMDGL